MCAGTEQYFLDKRYIKQLIKIIAELAAIAIAVVLFQFFIDRIGFGSAWPILVGALILLIVLIASVRK